MGAIFMEKFMVAGLEVKQMKRRIAPPPTQMTVEDVMAEAGIGRNAAYQLIKKLNTELETMGKVTFRGRVNRRFFEERVCYNGERG